MGIGVVGSGTFNVLKRNQQEIQRRAGRGIEITMVADLDEARARAVVGPDVQVVNDARKIIANPDIDIVIELIGGYGIAKTLVLEAIAAGKHVVTANKALLAQSTGELAQAAEQAHVDLYFEAAVAGAIPVIRPLTQSLAGDTVLRVAGIVNGTTNYILSAMDDSGASYDSALADASALGYAEADPTADVGGYDAAAKAAILASIAFHTRVTADDVYREGMTKVSAADFESAKALGCTIKLLAICERLTTGKGKQRVSARVYPALVPLDQKAPRIVALQAAGVV